MAKECVYYSCISERQMSHDIQRQLNVLRQNSSVYKVRWDTTWEIPSGVRTRSADLPLDRPVARPSQSYNTFEAAVAICGRARSHLIKDLKHAPRIDLMVGWSVAARRQKSVCLSTGKESLFRPCHSLAQWRSRMFESGVYTKNRTYRKPFTSTVRASLAVNPGPSLFQKKIEFGIGEDAISRCHEGLTCTLQSLLSRYFITFSIPPPPAPYFGATLNNHPLLMVHAKKKKSL